MARVIRNYRPGSQVIVAERLHGDGRRNQVAEPLERARALLQAAHAEAEAVRQEAQALLAAAQEEAEQIRAAAQIEADTIRATAQAQGYEAGYRDGLIDGQTKAQSALAEEVSRIQALLDAVQRQRARLMHNAQAEVLALVMAACERIVGHIAQAHRPLIVHTVTKALDALSVEGPFTVRLHPQDQAFLEQHWQVAEQSDPEAVPWRLVADPDVAPGGCVVQCGPATVDARLTTQLRALAQALDLDDYTLPEEDPGHDHDR